MSKVPLYAPTQVWLSSGQAVIFDPKEVAASLINSHANAIFKRWHLWEIDLRFALNSTPGWLMDEVPLYRCPNVHTTAATPLH